ncbi:toxin-antitoxin system YwqK family antitoxin [Pseudomonas koreensis]|uniref:toxin-antitoxin system YwqK family antitoxin n=1 Tax=Pseudomonas koreensis TaxID=198620 RepID=UPI003F86CA7D
MDNPPLLRHNWRLDEGIRMKWLWALALMAGLTSQAVNAAEFYENKTLAHPLIQGLQESSATLAFIKEAGGVKGYYCVCDTPEASPQLLDDYGQATIESVFLMSLDSEDPTRFVLFRQNDRYKVYAYKYDAIDHLYSRITRLQSALDRITEGQKHLDALTIKKALSRITPLNYRLDYEASGVPEFDQIDFSQGKLVGYYGQYYDPLPDPTPDAEPYFFKKTYQEKDGRFLTVTFWRWLDATLVEGNRTLYNYRVRRIAWETDPAKFTGSEDGQSVSYDSGSISAQGAYNQGVRIGAWSISKDEKYSESGSFAEGKREGQWTIYQDGQTLDGEYHNDLREGRWQLSNYDEMEWVASGFQTYAHGQLNGPSELTTAGVTERGCYVDGRRQGPWETKAGNGTYTDNLQSGPWTLKADNGHTQTVNFVAGKKDGELRDTDANGNLTYIEHYKAGVLSGVRESALDSGASQ